MSIYKFQKLQIKNFRNLHEDIINFGSNINCIIGKNGNGKTNILEGIFFLIYKKSFKKHTYFPQILSLDCERAEISISSVIIDNELKTKNFSAKLNEKNFDHYLDGKILKKRIKIDTVFINPFDAYSFYNTAAFRRDWFNRHISILDNDYKKDLSNFTKALKFRNKLLSEKSYDYRRQILGIDSEIAKYSLKISKARNIFIDEISNFYSKTFKKIFSEEHLIEIKRESKFLNATEQHIKDFLASTFIEDDQKGVTTYGIHKDDYVIQFDGLNSSDYASLGQQKVSYLSLLFAYIELFRYKFMTYPIVLIDDISGELDSIRWQKLVEYLKKNSFQVFITTANEKFSEELKKIDGAKTIEVIAGAILS